MESENVDYIEFLYSIYRKKKVLYIELKLKGISTTTICKIPYDMKDFHVDVVPVPQPKSNIYIVPKGGEGLSSIVQRIGPSGSSWKDIYEIEENKKYICNNITSHLLHLPEGTKLTIPKRWLDEN